MAGVTYLYEFFFASEMSLKNTEIMLKLLITIHFTRVVLILIRRGCVRLTLLVAFRLYETRSTILN